jgi:hypothetical protein
MLEKDLDQITESDLQELIDNNIPEGKKIDYKKELSRGRDKDKKEFLADVTSFSNTSGGYLIYGMDEDNGIASELVGLDIDDPDFEINKMENMIKLGVAPRIPSVHIKSVNLSNSKHAIIIKIGQSWISPHRVVLGGFDKFFTRTSIGKFQMDVSELRTAFTSTETLNEKIKNFRIDRISKITANEAPIHFTEDLKLIIHIIPVNAFSTDPYEISKIDHNLSIMNKLLPINAHTLGHNYNFDGFLYYEHPKDEMNNYVLLFRNGIIESVLGAYEHVRNSIGVVYHESDIIKYVSSYLEALKEIGIDTPLLIFLTLTGVKGYSILSSNSRNAVLIDRDILLMPDVMIENYDDKVENILKPVFDSVWNACGLSGSNNYDENGEWTQR